MTPPTGRIGRRQFLFGLGAAAGLSALARAGAVGLVRAQRAGRAMGSMVSMTVLHGSAPLAERALDAAFAELNLVDRTLSLYRPQSDVSRLNRDGSIEQPHPYLVEVLRKAAGMAERTSGAFDITVQPLWELYSAAQKRGSLPEEGQVRSALERVDWRKVQVAKDRVALGKGMAITLNGIAQGFAADRVVAALQEHGVEHALVNTGEFGVIGRKEDGSRWTIGIQHPRIADAYAAVAKMGEGFLSTSGDYETSFTPDRKDNHIFDPKTGHSPQSFSSASIIARTGIEADALSTAVFVLGPQRGLEMIERTPGAEALLILKNGRASSTKGFPRA